MPEKKPDDKRKPKPEKADEPDAHSAEVAFDDIIEAILNADPKAVRAGRKPRTPRRPTKEYKK